MTSYWMRPFWVATRSPAITSISIGSYNLVIDPETKYLRWRVTTLDHPVSTIISKYPMDFNRLILDASRTTQFFSMAALLRLPVIVNPWFTRWLWRSFLKELSWRRSALVIESDIAMEGIRSSQSIRRPVAILVSLGSNSLELSYSVGTIGLYWTTFRGKNIESHGFTIRVILTNSEIISKKETKYYDII